MQVGVGRSKRIPSGSNTAKSVVVSHHLTRLGICLLSEHVDLRDVPRHPRNFRPVVRSSILSNFLCHMNKSVSRSDQACVMVNRSS